MRREPLWTTQRISKVDVVPEAAHQIPPSLWVNLGHFLVQAHLRSVLHCGRYRLPREQPCVPLPARVMLCRLAHVSPIVRRRRDRSLSELNHHAKVRRGRLKARIYLQMNGNEHHVTRFAEINGQCRKASKFDTVKIVYKFDTLQPGSAIISATYRQHYTSSGAPYQQEDRYEHLDKTARMHAKWFNIRLTASRRLRKHSIACADLEVVSSRWTVEFQDTSPGNRSRAVYERRRPVTRMPTALYFPPRRRQTKG